MLGKYWVPSRERIVTEIKKDFMINAMELGYDIVIDNMNLNSNEVTYYKDLAASTSRLISPYVVEFKDFFIPLEVCIERDSKRENPVGEEIIRATYERYKHIIG